MAPPDANLAPDLPPDIINPPEDPNQLAARMKLEEMKKWWWLLGQQDIHNVAPKAVEYGSADLRIMGAAMQGLLEKAAIASGIDTPPNAGLEMAIAFYALGKAARLFGAYEQGKIPSNDTWDDLRIYATMGKRVRETGEWP